MLSDQFVQICVHWHVVITQLLFERVLVRRSLDVVLDILSHLFLESILGSTAITYIHINHY
jgi:hypothetical protein